MSTTVTEAPAGATDADAQADWNARLNEEREKAIEAGSEGAMQAAGLPVAADDDGGEPVELVIDGTGQLGFAGIGGKKPTDAKLTLTGGQIEVQGGFAKGEILVLRVEAVVREIDFIDKVDGKTNQVTGCTRKHKARIVSLTVEETG